MLAATRTNTINTAGFGVATSRGAQYSGLVPVNRNGDSVSDDSAYSDSEDDYCADTNPEGRQADIAPPPGIAVPFLTPPQTQAGVTRGRRLSSMAQVSERMCALLSPTFLLASCCHQA